MSSELNKDLDPEKLAVAEKTYYLPLEDSFESIVDEIDEFRNNRTDLSGLIDTLRIHVLNLEEARDFYKNES